MAKVVSFNGQLDGDGDGIVRETPIQVTCLPCMQTGIGPEKRGMLLFMCKDNSLKALHIYGGQGHWSIVIQKPDCCCSREVACGFQKDVKQATEL